MKRALARLLRRGADRLDPPLVFRSQVYIDGEPLVVTQAMASATKARFYPR